MVLTRFHALQARGSTSTGPRQGALAAAGGSQLSPAAAAAAAPPSAAAAAAGAPTHEEVRI